MPVIMMMAMLTSLVQLSNSCSTAQLREPARSIKLQVSSCRHRISCCMSLLCCFISRPMPHASRHAAPSRVCQCQTVCMVGTADASDNHTCLCHWCSLITVGF